MKSSRLTEVPLQSSAQQLTDHNVGTELTTAWKGLVQSKAALRHIENHLEAAPGTGVLLDSVMDLPKKKSSRSVRSRDGGHADDNKRSSKRRGRSQQSPDKSNSRSPLRNTTQDSNVRRNNSVEFREPLASYREATPPPHPSSQLEAYSLQSLPQSSHTSSPHPPDPLLSPLVYQRDTRGKQTDRDLDCTHSLALEGTDVRYLNDQPALDTLSAAGHQSHLTVPAAEGTDKESTPKAQSSMESQELSPFVPATTGTMRRGESTPSSSPGSASQRLENLRRHQYDDKLEKLKERIRRQRQHLEEAAEREKLLGYLEKPIMATVGSNNTGTRNMPTAKIRKVAAAPSAPIYKGFNSTETKIQTPDGKVWKEEEFHNLSREIYRDLSRRFAERTRSRHQQQREQRADRSKERRPPKPVRKVHRAATSSDLNAKPVISPASWREGQKVVKMVLGPVPKLPRKDRPQSADGLNRTVSRHRSSSDPRTDSKTQFRPKSTERPCSGFHGQINSNSTTTSAPSPAERDKPSVGVSAEMWSADIQGILDDLQLECKAAEKEERARQRVRGGSSGKRARGGSGSRTRTSFSAWGTTGASVGSTRGCHSASPTRSQTATAGTAETAHKKRHYDADSVRQYISRQQEERKRRQAEEKKALREESERRNQRLQELYRKQREVAKTVSLPIEVPVAPVQKRLQETYNKLLLEGAQLDEEATQTQSAAPSSQMRPMYQPSGESDKENKRLEAPHSPSSSDRSLNDQPPPPLSRNDLDVGFAPYLQPGNLSPAVRSLTSPSSGALAPYGDRLLSQLLRLETAETAGDTQHVQRPATASIRRSHSKMLRIEALKATAASLSNRIEYEARKFTGEGINYGTATSMNVDTILAPPQASLGDGCWVKTAATEKNDISLEVQDTLNGRSFSPYNGAALPGSVNLHSFRGRNEIYCPQINPAVVAEPLLNSHSHERRWLVNGLEKPDRMVKIERRQEYGLKEDKNRTDLHDSSAGSISEGPLLSEGSFSEDEASPPHFHSNCLHSPADCLEAVEYCAGQKKDYERLSEFQKEAAGFSALSSPYAQHNGSKSAWEELNKGSPLSVINIFTKNLHGHVRVNERNSPSAHSLHSGNSPVNAAVYEDDFVSSHSSEASAQLKRSSNSNSMSSHFEELMKRSPYEKSIGGMNSHHSSFHSSVHSPHLSSGSASGSSPISKHSTRKRGTASDQSDATLVEEQRSSCSPPSEPLSSDSKKRGSDKSSAHSQAKSVHSNDASEKISYKSSGLDSKKTSATRSKQASPSSSPDSPHQPVKSVSLGASNPNTATTSRSCRAEINTTGELQYSPAVLQQRMAAELQYLESIEESVRQLGDMERLMGVSMAHQESASLAQMLKVKQERHERELYELKIKAEREALETQLQLEENRQRLARAHIEMQEGLAGAQKDTLEGLQESTMKMMSQQAEAAQYTADAARHIKEMAELARSQMAGALVVPPIATDASMLDKREERGSSYSKQQQDKIDSESFQSEASRSRTRQEEPLSSLNSCSSSYSSSFRRPKVSGENKSSHNSPPQIKTDAVEEKWKKEGAEERKEREAGSSSIEEEGLTAANDSLCSDNLPCVDEKGDSTSVATEYSLKFDESMTEDEIEERSFRSLLPSEAHRRGTKEKSRHHEESEDDGATHNTALVSGTHNILKSQDASTAFSGGQDSFSQFTMDMVRQYMKDEEVRLQHQSSLLRLRQKALKEKTKTELAWLEHQKKRLRDKGEDDKMPPIRKKQRGLLIKLQQEQAEIKRLQEANKAARKERQLLLKQQEEIERMRNSTLRLRERLKYAGGEPPPETPLCETPVSEAAPPNIGLTDDVRSPSPSLSISGSETSSIMQKLRKMRSHMDEKFLTKREQQLMQRRHHAEELLQWKQRLDQEEAEVRRMEKEALAVWNRQTSRDKDMADEPKIDITHISPSPSYHQSSEPRTDSEKEYASEVDCSSATPESSIHTEVLGSQQTGRPSSVHLAAIPETPLASVQSSPANYTQDFSSASESHSRQSLQSPFEGSHSPAASPSDSGSKTKMQLCSISRTTKQGHIQPTDSAKLLQTEPISDQCEIESRIKALKEELKKRKFMAYQLKEEQKKRHKERLKAQEASLLKQLENYDNFIEKTKAELNKEPDTTLNTKSLIIDSTSTAEQSSIITPEHRSETSKPPVSERTQIEASLNRNALGQLHYSKTTSVPEELSDDPPIVTPTPGYGSPEGLLRPYFEEPQIHMIESGDDNIESNQRSDIQEDLEKEVSYKSDDQLSEHLLNLEKDNRLDSQEKLSTIKHVSATMKEEHVFSPFASQDQNKQIKTNETSNSMPSRGSHSAEMDLKIPPNPSCSSSSGDYSCSPDLATLISKEEVLIKDVEASSPIADSYHDDFESSVHSSPREERHNSKPASHISLSPAEIKGLKMDSPSRATVHDSQDEEVEEEIAEELSHHLGDSESSHQSGRLLDLHSETEKSKNDSRDIVNSIHSPPISAMQNPALIDELSSFNVGDRVLVGGVQPGTLRFKGPTSFANGFWAGVELDKSEGSNNGTYDGVGYFVCDENHGIFAPPDKITHLPDKFEIYTDTTEDEDSFFDDLPDKGGNRGKTEEDISKKEGHLKNENEQTYLEIFGSGDNNVSDEFIHKDESHNESKYPISNGNTREMNLDFDDAPNTHFTPDMDKISLGRHSQKEIIALDERGDVDSQLHFSTADLFTEIRNDGDGKKDTGGSLDTIADKFVNNFLKDTVKQFSGIKKAKEQKIEVANQMNGDPFGENFEKQEQISSVEQKDGLPFFLPVEQEELSSPELCNRPESPVLGASGQEELAKRLAELELSRELLDELGDDQDWFDEDFGLSSRREQQRLKRKEEEARLGGGGELERSGAVAAPGGLISSQSGEQQVKIPPRPELPLPLPPKLPEQPAMVVPHSATEVEKMVYAATQEIWECCGLGKEGALTLAQLPVPKPSQEYLGRDASSQGQEALCVHSYKKAVYDLTWEILQEIYADDPNTDQPQWIKPRRVKSFYHRVKTPGDITKIQEFIAAEVLKLYGLTKGQNLKTDWQKMLKFGRKKRDRVDHILVQELHEEEAQWVNYDEDELFVKMQLADSIFDALLKDTANVLTLIFDKRAKRDTFS